MSRRTRRAPAPTTPLPPEPVTGAWIAIALLATVCVLVTVTFRPFETDLWQHLLVGKVIWTEHRVPTAQVWSWPTYGTADTTTSYAWLFRALLWPVWSLAGVWGLQVWRWVTTLLAFALAWHASRTLGARGYAPLVLLVLCALVYRQRSQVRPETLASVLLALELWLLERRRQGAPLSAWWLAGLLWVWVNVHVSWVLGALVLAPFAIDELRRPATRGAPLWLAGLAALALSFLNPYGWRAVWQPFHFVAMMREPLLRSIGELRGIDWHYNLRNGLPLLLAGWPLAALWRWRSRRGDWIETLLAIGFAALTLRSSRASGFLAVAACLYLGRDVSEWFRNLRPRPEALRAALAGATMIAILPAELMRPDLKPGIEIVPSSVPIAACDFVESAGIRGRAFNHFEIGGYMLWRFWPDRDRLPFMDIHQAGTPAERLIYLQAQVQPESWNELAGRYRIDWCLLRRQHAAGDRLLEFLDADSSWALVFVDDVAAVYVRRDGPLRAVADRFGYRWWFAGNERLGAVWASAIADRAVRRELRTELERCAAATREASTARSLLASIALAEQRWDDAARELRLASRIDPGLPAFHQRMGLAELYAGRPRPALEHFLTERRHADSATIEFDLGLAHSALGDLPSARRAFLAASALNPENTAARDSVAAIDRRLGH